MERGNAEQSHPNAHLLLAEFVFNPFFLTGASKVCRLR